MSSDWRRGQGDASAYPQTGQPEPASPFMRTAFGYSTPNQGVQSPPQDNLQVNYQQEVKSTPTSVLLPVGQEQGQLRGKLSTIKGEQAGDSWFLNRSHTTLGRALDNDIVLLDIAASRKHAQVIRGEQGFSLLDLRSANGVFLNGRRVTEEELYDGDEIEIGETVLRFESLGQSRQRELLDDDTSPGIDPIIHHSPPSAPNPSVLPYPGKIPLPPINHPRSTQKPPQRQIPVPAGPHQGAQRDSNKQMHVTYGFGSQWSQEDLGVSLEPLQVQRPSLSPLERLHQHVYRVKFEIQAGRGRKAMILRLSLALTVLLIFFAFGGIINKLTNGLIDEPTPSAITGAEGNVSGGGGPLITLNGSTTSKVPPIEASIQSDRAERLLTQRRWRELIKLLKDQSAESISINDPRGDALLSQAERGLIDEEAPKILQAIERGSLGVAESSYSELSELLSNRTLGQLIPLSYSLWIHRRELGDLSALNPPPREQRALKRSAQLASEGKYRRALKALKQRRPNRRRLSLFKLREASLKVLQKRRSTITKMRDQELQYLLGQSFDYQELLQQYRARIEQGVRKTQYKEVAPWLEAAILLSVDQPQIRQYFKRNQTQLRAEAIKWLSIAESESKRNKGLSRALLEAAIPYLSKQNVQTAKRLMKKLKRR